MTGPYQGVNPALVNDALGGAVDVEDVLAARVVNVVVAQRVELRMSNATSRLEHRVDLTTSVVMKKLRIRS